MTLNKVLSWTAVLLWMVLIFNLSAQVADESDKLSKGVTRVIVQTVERVVPNVNCDIKSFNHWIRKNAHFFAYLVLGILVVNALSGRGYKFVAILICVLYAISDEVHQIFVPGRGPGIQDVFIDSLGASVGILMYLGFSRIKGKSK